MRSLILVIIVCCLAVPAISRADDAKDQEAARDVGAILGWRYGPEAVEESCRSLDPEGAEVREQAYKAWLEKNAALIKAVDIRIAEVVPLIYPIPTNVDAVEAVRAEVKAILIEPIFAGKTRDEVSAICRAEANPVSPRWNNPGMPQVQQSLAALLDWQTQRAAK